MPWGPFTFLFAILLQGWPFLGKCSLPGPCPFQTTFHLGIFKLSLLRQGLRLQTLNVLATWHLAELTAADMKAHGKGSIIAVQSCGGFTPIPPAIAYGVSKAALLFLVRELAKTQAPHTRVNCLCVGSMSPDGQEAEIHRGLGLAERNAIKRFGAADEAVGAAILLASDASSYTTGSTIFTEGGRVGTIA